ncbi:MAG TPA: efflux transporter outer membrane subunit [Casimicrobiaceae bacterium]
MRKLTLALAFAAGVTGCSTTPTAPPVLDLPKTSANDPALERWWTAFGDPTLTSLVDEALARNLDLAAAIARVDQARAQYKIVQFGQLPQLNAGFNAARSRQTLVGTIPIPAGVPAIGNDFVASLNASYEVDLWGKYSTATKAAQNDLLASQFARETVRTVVAAEVARAYFRLLASDAQLSVLSDTLRLRTDTVVLQTDRFNAGVIGEFDLATAQAERAAVASDVAVAQRVVSENLSALAVLVGRSPREVFEPKFDRDVQMVRLLAVPDLPAQLPSEMLERRPDIRDAEKQLAAANQRIDVARADYFPSLSLTGAFGSESNVMKSLFSGPALLWSIGAGLVQPLIGLALINDTVELRTAQRDESVTRYVQTVQSAFRDAHDALSANQTTRDALAAQTERKDRLQKSLELADLRYTSGYSPYLEVLDVQRQLLQAQSLQIVAARDVRLAVVDVAKALGGGWDYKTAVAGP